MAQYIEKSTLVAEIEKRRDESWLGIYTKEKGIIFDITDEILSFLDTLEVDVDLENSMVCKAKWHDGFFLDYTQEQQDALLEKIGATCGDKIRVILIKE